MTIVPIRESSVTQQELRDLIAARNIRLRTQRRENVLLEQICAKLAAGAEVEAGRHDIELRPIVAERVDDESYRFGHALVVR